jgi:hypothetical protein
MNFNEIELDDTEPSFDDIKKLADSKRPYKCKTYTKEDRIKNLELARQKRKYKPLKTKTEPKTETELDIEPESPIVIMKHYKKKPEPIKRTDSYDVLFDNITNLKDLIINQQEKIDTIIKKNTKKPRVKKVKEPVKSLDLTITHTEIKNIIENNDKDKILEAIDKGRAYDIKNNTDVKLKAFLDAMTKKKY